MQNKKNSINMSVNTSSRLGRETRQMQLGAHKIKYTLIEMIMALAIMVLAAAAVTAAASSAVGIFKRVRDYRETRVQMILALQRIERDLCNAFSMDTLPLTGEINRIRIPGIIFQRGTVQGQALKVEPGQVEYYLKQSDASLVRETLNYAQATAPEQRRLSGQVRTLVKGVKQLHFRYYQYDPETRQYGWKNSWQDEESRLPLAVEIELQSEEKSGQEYLKKTVFLPTADRRP